MNKSKLGNLDAILPETASLRRSFFVAERDKSKFELLFLSLFSSNSPFKANVKIEDAINLEGLHVNEYGKFSYENSPIFHNSLSKSMYLNRKFLLRLIDSNRIP